MCFAASLAKPARKVPISHRYFCARFLKESFALVVGEVRGQLLVYVHEHEPDIGAYVSRTENPLPGAKR
jgi:hypothetical protein